jgi:cell division protein FtsB
MADESKAKGFTARFSNAGDRLYNNRRKLATAAAAALAVTVGWHVVFGQNGLTVFRTKRHDVLELQQQVRELQGENTVLRGHVDRLTNDPGAIEHEAREDLHYTRPGEVIYTLPADAAAKR